MEETSNLNLPYIMPSQAQKHVTHNEALVLLDAIVQLAVQARDLSSPPESAADGERYLVPTAATGIWAGWDNAIALRLDGGWRRINPGTGWIAWIADEDTFVAFDGEEWVELGETLVRIQYLEKLGLGTAADSENPFAAKLNKALWTALASTEGGDGDLRYTLNKEGSGNVLSLLMQSSWTGHVELGLVGDDDLSCKVSDDGETWLEGFRVDHVTGQMSFPNTPVVDALSSLTGTAGSFARYDGEGEATMQQIVGTVAQSGGVPTGAIIERGTNASGSYIRFADGTQICHHRAAVNIAIDVAFGGGYRSAPQAWTFPMAFATGSTDEIIVQASAGAVSHSVQAVATSETAAVWYHMQPGSAAAEERPATLLAIGRWF